MAPSHRKNNGLLFWPDFRYWGLLFATFRTAGNIDHQTAVADFSRQSLPPLAILKAAGRELFFTTVIAHQSTADNRVPVRFNGQHFLPVVDNHEAEIQGGLALRCYGSRALAVGVDLVRTGDGSKR